MGACAALAVLVAGLVGRASAQCTAPASASECSAITAGTIVDCFTGASGVCSPAALATDDICDERLNCGAPDPKCNFATPTMRHPNANHYGGLIVRHTRRRGI